MPRFRSSARYVPDVRFGCPSCGRRMLVAVVDGWQEIYAVSPVLEHGTEATGDLMYQLACSRFPRCRTTVEITRARVVELVRQAIAAGTRDVSLKDRVPH